jgi:lysophospholipase L1-like esterase
MDDDAPTTPPAPEQPAETPAPQPQQPEVDWQAEASKWKEMARKHESANKVPPSRLAQLRAAEKELETIRESQLSETEKAVKEAEARGAATAASQFGQKIAAAELKAALAGLIPDPAGVIEDLNLAKFVTDTGDVDADAVAALREKYALLAPAKNAPAPNLHQGRQGPPTPGQLTRADLAHMNPDDINKAIAEGRLDEVRGIKTY